MITKPPVYQPRLVDRGLEEGDDRIRTGDQGFADPCLTTWPRRQNQTGRLCACRSFFGAGEEIRTLDLLLGKETFYR